MDIKSKVRAGVASAALAAVVIGGVAVASNITDDDRPVLEQSTVAGDSSEVVEATTTVPSITVDPGATETTVAQVETVVDTTAAPLETMQLPATTPAPPTSVTPTTTAAPAPPVAPTCTLTIGEIRDTGAPGLLDGERTYEFDWVLASNMPNHRVQIIGAGGVSDGGPYPATDASGAASGVARHRRGYPGLTFTATASFVATGMVCPGEASATLP